MNLRQLKTLCEVVDRGLHVTDAARATYRSQSSVTRQIQLLESELGCELFVRKRNKLLGMTPYGEEILGVARRILHDSESMKRIAQNATHDEAGEFTIATTSFQAKNVLPSAIQRFIGKYPRVHLSLRQGTPAQCVEYVAMGKADLAICAAGGVPDSVAVMYSYRLHRSIITPLRHPLLKLKRLTLEALVRYPLITYDEAFNGSYIVNKAFSEAGLSPNTVLSAVDADVSKVYVRLGLGIAITPSVAFDPAQDTALRRIDARHLFKPSDVGVILRRRTQLRTFMFDFIQIFSPLLPRPVVEDVLFRKSAPPPYRPHLPEL